MDRVRAHERHFTFGLNVGKAGCKVPTAGLDWRPTVQPIALEWWTRALSTPEEGHIANGAWTTVMNWASYKPEEFEGESYGQKDVEFMRFAELPGHVGEETCSRHGTGTREEPPDAISRILRLENHRTGLLFARLRHLPRFSFTFQSGVEHREEWIREITQRLVQLPHCVLSSRRQAGGSSRYRMERAFAIG